MKKIIFICLILLLIVTGCGTKEETINIDGYDVRIGIIEEIKQIIPLVEKVLDDYKAYNNKDADIVTKYMNKWTLRDAKNDKETKILEVTSNIAMLYFSAISDSDSVDKYKEYKKQLNQLIGDL